MSHTVRFRLATTEDASLLWRWRNDPLTRAMSRTTDEIPIEQHVAWLYRYLSSDRGRLFIALDGETAIGTMRVDFGPTTELSWTVAPECRGIGMGRAMVRAFVDSYADDYGPFIAEIKATNGASLRIAAHARIPVQVIEA